MNELVRKAQKMQKMTKLVLAPTTPPWTFLSVGFNSKISRKKKVQNWTLENDYDHSYSGEE